MSKNVNKTPNAAAAPNGDKSKPSEQDILNAFGRALFLNKGANATKSRLRKENDWLEHDDAKIKGVKVTFEVNGVTIQRLLDVDYKREIVLKEIPGVQV